MLIVLIGPPQAGKSLLARHLAEQYAYKRVYLGPGTAANDACATGALHFQTSTEFLDHATRLWKVDYVTTDLRSSLKLQEFSKRPFVAIVAIDAPLSVRYSRSLARARSTGASLPALEHFVATDDEIIYGLASALGPSEDQSDTTTRFLHSKPTTPLPLSLSPSSDAPPSPSPSPLRPSSPVPVGRRSGAGDPLVTLLPFANATLRNAYASPRPFFDSLLLPTLEAALRPSWDPYFMLLASLASLRSNCMKRRVGAVLVRERRVVSTGYNGTPRGVRNCNDGGCGRCNSHSSGFANVDTDSGEAGGAFVLKGMGEGLDECLCLHAEENALLEAGRERVSGGGTEGATLYCNTCPCLRCTVKIVQCGVMEVVYSLSYSMDAASRRVMDEAGVGLRQIEMPAFP